MQENKNSQGMGVNKLLLAVAIVEAVVIIGLLINMNNTKKETERLINQIEVGTMEKDSLNHEMSLIVDNYNQLKTTNDTINAQLEEQKAKVVELMENLRRTKASNRDSLKKYKAEIETMRSIMRSFIVQIDSLNTKNIMLTEENNRLTGQLSNVKNENKKLSNAKDSLQGRVKEAEALKAVGLKLVALNDRDNETTRIIKTQKFRVTFTINENEMTKTGEKDVFVRIVKPNGEILKNENTGFFKYQGNEIAYSGKKTINYDGKAQATTLYAISREVLSAGIYQADIFCDGKNIGSVSVKLD
jgi:predicted  nucleic acid-binding Zn-ribbon protein